MMKIFGIVSQMGPGTLVEAIGAMAQDWALFGASKTHTTCK